MSAPKKLPKSKKKKRKGGASKRNKHVLVVNSKPGLKHQKRISFGSQVFLPEKTKRSNYAMLTNREIRRMCREFETLTDQEINEMREMFNMLDEDGTGVIDVKEIEYCLKGLKLLPEDPEKAKQRILAMMRVADHDMSGKILFGEFVGLCVDIGYTKPMSNVGSKVNCQELFDIFGGEVRLTIELLQEKLKFITGERYSKESVLNILNAVDENNDGLITLDEFSEIIKLGEKAKRDEYYKYY